MSTPPPQPVRHYFVVIPNTCIPGVPRSLLTRTSGNGGKVMPFDGCRHSDIKGPYGHCPTKHERGKVTCRGYLDVVLSCAVDGMKCTPRVKKTSQGRRCRAPSLLFRAFHFATTSRARAEDDLMLADIRYLDGACSIPLNLIAYMYERACVRK